VRFKARIPVLAPGDVEHKNEKEGDDIFDFRPDITKGISDLINVLLI